MTATSDDCLLVVAGLSKYSGDSYCAMLLLEKPSASPKKCTDVNSEQLCGMSG